MIRHLDILVATIATLGLVACAGVRSGETSATAEAATTEYYFGTVTTSSPDGRIPYGTPVVTLLKREIAPRDGRIVESLLQEGITTVTVLRRQTQGTFAASGEDGRGMGTITVEGNEWKWRRWNYALAAAKGEGKIQGSGRHDGEWMETEKYVVAPNGERRARISDRLMAISNQEYARRHSQMVTASVRRK